MYYNTQTHTFGHSHNEVARETNSSFAVGELVVGDYRFYEMAPEPAYNPDTQRIELTSTPVQRVGQPWLRGWVVVALTAAEMTAIAKAKVPASVTMRQGRLALLAAGKLAQVDAAIASLPEPQKSAALIEWNFSNELQRGNAFVATLGAALGLSDAQVDQLFITAAAL